MKKVVSFLEGYVQWIALAIGALFLGFTIYTYVLQTPVMVKGVGSTELNPGEVDNVIEAGPAHSLEMAMKDTRMPEMKVPNFVDDFKTQLDETSYRPDALAMNWTATRTSVPILTLHDTKVAPEQPIDKLPVLAAANLMDYSSGKSNVTLGTSAPASGQSGGPPMGAQDMPPPGMVGAPGEMPPGPGIFPGAPPAAPGGAAVQPVSGGVDRAWVTVRYSISPKSMLQAFNDAHIPNWTESTAILSATLWREEQLPNGQWSNKQAIAPINANLLSQYPGAGDVNGEMDFVKWASAHVADILQPSFLIVNRGDAWSLPGATPVNLAASPNAMQPLDPSKTYDFNTLMKYSLADRQKYAHDHQAAMDQKSKSSRRPAGGGPGGPGDTPPPGMPTPVILDHDRMRSDDSLPFGAPGDAPPPGMPTDVPPPGFMPDQAQQQQQTQAQANAAAMTQAAGTLPHGDFDPRSLQADIIGWAHDVTATPGHVYRYTVTYKIKNPIFRTNASKILALVNQFDLESPEGSWTGPITIATSTNFFLAANSAHNATAARFKVFKWENGVEKMRDFEVSPGDVIGAKVGDTDFSTGWTVVALRFDDPRNPDGVTVSVMNSTGLIEQRDYRTDQSKPELKTLTDQAGQASASAAGAPSGG